MDAFTPMTTCDILGFALLAVLSERPRSRTAAVETVRALCLPWLTPIREVVGGLVSDYCAARYLAARYLHEKGDPRNLVDAELEGFSVMLNGMGSLSYGELAGERMQLGLMLHDPEEEHDCFSDNTHNSHYDDARGIYNVYHGRYPRIDGSVVEGPSLSSLVRAAAPDVDADMRARLDATAAAMQRLKDTADSGAMAYDQMLGESNPEGNAIVQEAVDALKAQTRVMEQAAVALGVESLEIEGSDSLDDPGAVFK